MKTSETITKIAPAFIKAQAEFGKATKDQNNPFFKSKYADLNAYLNATTEALANNGLAVLQDTSGSEQAQIIRVSTRLIHSSGEWMESEPLVLHPTDMKPQSFGSAQTYGRRYSLASFLGLGAEDDDGNKASKPKPMPTRASVNGELLEMKTIEEFNAYAKNFQVIHGKGVWSQLSGKRGNKTETWKNVFDTHKDRISGVSPIDNRTPEQLDADFKYQIDNPGDDWAMFDLTKKMYDENPHLKVTKNKKALDALEAELTERLGER